MSLKQLAFQVLIYGFSLFYASLIILNLLFQWIQRPLVNFWQTKRRDLVPACLTDDTYGQHSYVQLKDVKLHYVENGDRSKPLMLLVHGFPEFWYSWRHQIKEFTQDYWTVAIDMRGYGDSDKPSGVAAYNINLLVDDLRQLIIALGRDKCVLVAHDWGGVVAWHFVCTHPEMIQRYIIMDAPYFPLYSKLVKSNLQQFLKAWYTFFFQLPFLPELSMKSFDFARFEQAFREGKDKCNSKITDDDLEAYKYVFGKPGAMTPPINYYRCNMWRGIAKRDASEKQQFPDNPPHGLLIWGENDNYLNQELVRMSREKVKNLQTHIVIGANHFVQQDEPEAVNKAMRNFLQQNF